LTSQPRASTPGAGRRGRTKVDAPAQSKANGARPDARLNGRRIAKPHEDKQTHSLNGGRALTGRSAEPATAPARRRTRPAPPAASPTPAAPPSRVPAPAPPAPPAAQTSDHWDDRVADLLAFARRRLTGQYEVDEFGFDPDLTDNLLYPLLRQAYRHYFRVECTGVENLPDGPALIVGNHSGTIPIDAAMLTVAVHDETPLRRHLRLLGADLVFRVPILSELARKSGSTLACNPDAERLLRQGQYVGVFPEGFKGIGKPYRDRYKLQRFGRGGFVSAALRTGTPIVPVSIVGAEEIYPIIGNIRPLARVTGLPYVPITPLFPWLGPLGLLPLPSKWLIEFGKPIDTTPYADEADDPIVVFNLADQVRETIQQTLHSLLERRPDPFG
jgi:1-acyl-sn-glycerol-3-phosphate acyltransferase